MKKFSRLPEPQKQMIRDLAHWGNYSSEEIAKAFNLNVSSIRTLRGNHTRKLQK